MFLQTYVKRKMFLFLLLILAINSCGVQDPDNYNRQGVLFDSQGKLDEAMQYYKKALSIDPYNRDATAT